MKEGMSVPRRLAETKEVEALVRELPTMRMIIEHQRGSRAVQKQNSGGRKLKSCVQVQLWTDDAGRESIVVLGDEGAGSLELKGLLHDGVYALAHQGEPGFIPRGD